MTHKTVVLVTLTASLIPLSLASVACAEEDLETRIIWEDEEHTQALFIPEKVLNSTPIEKLPIDEQQRYELRGRIAFWREKPEGRWMPGGHVPDCNPASRALELPNPLPTLVEIVNREEGAFLGTVINSVTGFRPKLDALAIQMQYVVATKLLRDARGVFEVGGVYATPLFHGSMNVLGTVLCQDPEPNRDFPRVGDQVLVVGTPYPADRILIPTFAFLVEDNTILQGRYGYRSFAQSMTVDALIMALEGR